MNNRLLTLDNLIEFYNKKKKSMKFDASESGEPIVVQVPGNMVFKKDDKDYAEGLTRTRLQACHTDRNLNSSGISYDNMKDNFLPTFVNRPILGYIHYVDNKPQFYDHRMHIEENEDGEEVLVYDEIAVGIIPETNNAELVYDDEMQHYNVFVDGYIFNEYTEAAEILEREEECAVSVEISISKMAYNAKDKFLDIQDGYISGVTILGVDEDGNKVMPGMAKSNIKLKDFSESNNSLFSSITEDEQEQLIEMREKINTLLSRFNINEETQENYGKEEIGLEEIKVNNEEVTETEEVEVTETEETSTEEVTEAVIENESEETVETPEMVETEAEEEVEAEGETETKEVVETEESDETENTEDTADVTEVESTEENEVETVETVETEEVKFETISKEFERDGRKFSVSFELSHDDIKYGLYNLIGQFEELDNEWYGIRAVYDNHFVMQGYFSGAIYGCNYTVDGENVALDGERFKLYEELLTESEKSELDSMRANYSSISDKLAAYELAEVKAMKQEVVEDAAYAEFAETESFKEIKNKIDTYSVEELRTACDLAFAKEVKAKGTFALYSEEKVEKEEKKPSFFAFAKTQETDNSFLDGLLKK